MQSLRIKITLLTLASFLCLSLFAIKTAGAVDVNPNAKNISQSGLISSDSLNCDPTNSNLYEKTDGHPLPGCGPNAALQLIYNVISYIGYIVIPIATALLGYAGFRIMTAAGNSEQLGEAKSMMTKVVIGIAIIFLSTMVIRYVFIALQVNNEFKPAVESTKKIK